MDRIETQQRKQDLDEVVLSLSQTSDTMMKNISKIQQLLRDTQCLVEKCIRIEQRRGV